MIALLVAVRCRSGLSAGWFLESNRQDALSEGLPVYMHKRLHFSHGSYLGVVPHTCSNDKHERLGEYERNQDTNMRGWCDADVRSISNGYFGIVNTCLYCIRRLLMVV
jgi:hypothetical protein